MTENIPDSDWLASMVVAAFTEKRYELGEALARLCGQATRMEATKAEQQKALAELDAVIKRREAGAAVPQHEPKHVQELVRMHEQARPYRRETPEPSDKEYFQEMGKKYFQEMPEPTDLGACPPWCGVDGAVCASDRHNVIEPDGEMGVAPFSGSESDETPTQVTPSARCVATRSSIECHGVLYWARDGAAPGWMHLDPNLADHIPVANRPDPQVLR